MEDTLGRGTSHKSRRQGGVRRLWLATYRENSILTKPKEYAVDAGRVDVSHMLAYPGGILLCLGKMSLIMGTR